MLQLLHSIPPIRLNGIALKIIGRRMCYHLCIIILSSSLLVLLYQYNAIPESIMTNLFSLFNPCITVYGLPFLADNSKYVAALSFIFLKSVLKVM